MFVSLVPPRCLRLEELYLNWYNFANEALRYEVENPRSFGKAHRIVVVGMGGSAIAGDMIAIIANSTGSIPVFVWKDFYTPKTLIDDSTAVLAISYSGNTRETILSLEQALRRTDMVGVVASNGKLLEIAKEKRLPYIQVRRGLVPRAALPILLYASLALLEACDVKLVEKSDVNEGIEVLRDVETAKSDSIYIASYLQRARLPLIVATTRYNALATRVKNELNENAKMPAKVEIAPELFHNDIVGWEAAVVSDRALIIESDIEYERALLSFYAEYLQERGFEVTELKLRGRSLLARYLYGSLVAGLASVRIAKMRGVDPMTTHSISKYKNLVTALEDRVRSSIEY